MRIRKNKKLTASIIWSTAASSSSPKPPEELLQAHVCVVNRSPWDCPPSPPLPPFHHRHHLQVIEGDNDSFGMDGSLACDNNSIDSMKVSSDDYKSLTAIPNLIESGSSGHCPPNSCDLAAVSKNDNDKESALASIEPPKRRPGRPRKVAVAPPPPPQSTPANNNNNNNNPYEFYYYSGFGPRWGKRRGNEDDDHKPTTDNDDKKKKKKNRKRDTINACSSSYSRIVEVTDEELDFIDDDDDDDEDDNGGRKRVRKPVKARSLKSLIM